MAQTSPLPSGPPEEKNNPGDDEYEKLFGDKYSPDESKRQHTAAGNPTDPRSNDTAAGDSSDPRDEPTREGLKDKEESPEGPSGSFYRPGGSRSPRSFSRSRYSLRGYVNRRRALFGGGVVGTILAIVAFLFLSSGSLELVHIKNAFYKEVGGVQSRTYQLGRQKYYSRMFFFDKDGNFSGYKKQGIRGMMVQNRQTKKMVSALEKSGYKIEFEKINGRETGRVKALHAVDSNGKIGASITSNQELTRAWDIKKSGVIPAVLKSVYPDETARWHGRQAKKLYRRWGLTRTNWLGDYLKGKTGLTTLEKKELAFRSALRQHLFGGGTSSNLRIQQPGDKDIKDTADQTIASNEVAKKVSTDASAEVTDLLEDSKNLPREPAFSALSSGAAKDLSPTVIVSDAFNAAPKSILGSLNALSTASTVCTGKGALDSIVIGARVLRAAALMKFGMSVLNIADSLQNGKTISSDEISVMMTYLNSTDKNGHTMFASSGWRYWNDPQSKKGSFSFSKFDQEERNKYSVGGGFTGTLATIDSTLNQYKLGVGCKKVNNPFVQIGGFVVGIGAGILTGGTFTVTNAVASLGLGVVANVAVNIATEMLTPIVAGTVVHGGETGTAVGNALVSGLEVLSNANGANAGMMPLTSNQYKAALADSENYQKSQIAQMSLKDRLFSTENNHSLVMAAATGTHNLSMASVLRSPVSAVSNIFSSFPLFGHASAEDSTDGCTDPDIVKNELGATPFCSVELGIPAHMIDDPNYYPDVVDQRMIDGGYVDEDGNAIAGKGYDKYLAQCTSDTDSAEVGADFRSIDIIHQNNQNVFTGECMNTPLFNMYRFYTYIGQTENDGLTGSNISDNVPAPSTPGTSSGTVSGNAREIANQILQAAKDGRIKFAVLKSIDTFDRSTPEDNIKDTAAGQPANTTTTCGSANRGAQPPNTTVGLDTNLLKFILEVSQTQTIQITALAGQCHTSVSSNHYVGKAVDFGCPFNAAAADAVGAKYNISDKTGETCADPQQPHYHYSIGGN